MMAANPRRSFFFSTKICKCSNAFNLRFLVSQCESKENRERVLDGNGKFQHTEEKTLRDEVKNHTSRTKASIHETDARGSMVVSDVSH